MRQRKAAGPSVCSIVRVAIHTRFFIERVETVMCTCNLYLISPALTGQALYELGERYQEIPTCRLITAPVLLCILRPPRASDVFRGRRTVVELRLGPFDCVRERKNVSIDG